MAKKLSQVHGEMLHVWMKNGLQRHKKYWTKLREREGEKRQKKCTSFGETLSNLLFMFSAFQSNEVTSIHSLAYEERIEISFSKQNEKEMEKSAAPT